MKNLSVNFRFTITVILLMVLCLFPECVSALTFIQDDVFNPDAPLTDADIVKWVTPLVVYGVTQLVKWIAPKIPSWSLFIIASLLATAAAWAEGLVVDADASFFERLGIALLAIVISQLNKQLGIGNKIARNKEREHFKALRD